MILYLHNIIANTQQVLFYYSDTIYTQCTAFVDPKKIVHRDRVYEFPQ